MENTNAGSRWGAAIEPYLESQSATGTTSKNHAKNSTRSTGTCASQSTRQCGSIPMPHLRQKRKSGYEKAKKSRGCLISFQECAVIDHSSMVWVLFSHRLSLAVGGARERGNDDYVGCTCFLEHDDRSLQLYYICMYECVYMYIDTIMHALSDLYICKG